MKVRVIYVVNMNKYYDLATKSYINEDYIRTLLTDPLEYDLMFIDKLSKNDITNIIIMKIMATFYD